MSMVTMVWVEIRFKAPPGTSDSSLISQSFSSGQRNRAYWASQPQKSLTLQPQPGGTGGGETTKSERTCGGIGKKKDGLSPDSLQRAYVNRYILCLYTRSDVYSKTRLRNQNLKPKGGGVEGQESDCNLD